MRVRCGPWHQAHPCPLAYPLPPLPKYSDAQGFEIMSETAWYPKEYNVKPNITHLQCTKCSHGCPYSCIHSAHVYKAGRDCHPPFPGGQQSEG